MENQELLDKIKNGDLPKMGILRRTGAAKNVTVTTIKDGKREVVQDIDLTAEGGE